MEDFTIEERRHFEDSFRQAAAVETSIDAVPSLSFCITHMAAYMVRARMSWVLSSGACCLV